MSTVPTTIVKSYAPTTTLRREPITAEVVVIPGLLLRGPKGDAGSPGDPAGFELTIDPVLLFDNALV